MPDSGRLGRVFFDRNVVDVARVLIGRTLWTARPEGVTAGLIVETEAYSDASDPASHAARRKSCRVHAMVGLPGIAYVYRSYGIHTMLNLVADAEGVASAVLIRALEPIEGASLMRERRGVEDLTRLCKGPGSLTIAMGIRLDDHGVDVTASDWIWISPPTLERVSVAGERIGISRGKELPWRFFVPDSPFVSAHRRPMAIDSTL
jgi:DNA-3-methyladenine glycosylase